MTREDTVTSVISEAPESAQNTLRRAFSGDASPRQAIKAQCLTCTGFLRESIKNCTGFSCPLWLYRPFTNQSRTEDEYTEGN
jgi:hypothetical protein